MAAQPASAPARRRRLSSLPLFSVDAGNQVAPSPDLAHAWAEAIVDYWRHYQAEGKEQEHPFYLLDLQPRDGAAAWLLLNALKARLMQQGLQIPWCYLACHDNTAAAEQCAAHPYFLQWSAQGLVDFACWNDRHDALSLRNKGVTLVRSEHPVVIIAFAHFQTLASELFCIHQGQPMAGVLAGETIDTARLDYQWKTCDDETPSPPAAMLAHYRLHCNGSVVQLPLLACARLDACDRLGNGRSLLLAADRGISEVRQIRLGALYPPANWSPGDAAPPVNFDALRVHQQQHGAATWQRQSDDDGLVLYAAWRDDAQAVPPQVFGALATLLAQAAAGDVAQLARMAHDPAACLSLLRLSRYDPQLLKQCIGSLLDKPPACNEGVRRDWGYALRCTWSNYFPPAGQDGFCYQMALLALYLGEPGLARQCLRLSLAWYGEQTAELYLLSLCESLSGGVAEADVLLGRALACEPLHAQSLALRAELTARLATWREHAWYLPQRARSGTLALEPLGREHAAAMLYQYRDPQIGIMSCLPPLESIDQVHQWMEREQRPPARAGFAVMHRDLGFVGMTCMHCEGATGYLYFWIGSDFQGCGLGRQAAALLIDMMRARGVNEIFTSAYRDNLRSIHTLTRLGFQAMALRALAPDDELQFFYLGRQAADDSAQRAGLCALCLAIGSPLTVAADHQ